MFAFQSSSSVSYATPLRKNPLNAVSSQRKSGVWYYIMLYYIVLYYIISHYMILYCIRPGLDYYYTFLLFPCTYALTLRHLSLFLLELPDSLSSYHFTSERLRGRRYNFADCDCGETWQVGWTVFLRGNCSHNCLREIS